MTRAITHIQDVVDWGLCSGCGICYAACPNDALRLINFTDIGIRPVIDRTRCQDCTDCLATCPGYRLEYRHNGDPVEKETAVCADVDIWEGYATDAATRLRASSGGILSAIATYCLEKGGMSYLIHTGMDTERPWLNRSVISRSRQEIVARSGSRYSPSSPGELLRGLTATKGTGVFIGKPCDAAGVVMIKEKDPALNRRLPLVMSLFCAGSPNTRGTLDLIHSLNVPREHIDALTYRGWGWPGCFTVWHNEYLGRSQMSYEQSWGRLSKYVPMRCRLCPIGLGQISDISCGDDWNRFPGDDTGRSIILTHTDRGKEMVRKARESGYIHIERTSMSALMTAQKNLLKRQTQIFGRMTAMRLLGVPTPVFTGFELDRYWRDQPFRTKASILLGTMKRILRRGLWHKNAPLASTTTP